VPGGWTSALDAQLRRGTEVVLRACGGLSTLSRDVLLTPASACVEQLQRAPRLGNLVSVAWRLSWGCDVRSNSARCVAFNAGLRMLCGAVRTQ
jgi:hypothetical protein